MTAPQRRAILLASLAVGVLFLQTLAEAHGVTRRDAAFVQSIDVQPPQPMEIPERPDALKIEKADLKVGLYAQEITFVM